MDIGRRPLIVAANRLPVRWTDDGWETSPGGLVRALIPFLRESGGTWVGWNGTVGGHVDPFEVEGVSMHPIALDADDVSRYYEGFANNTLWPLYHDAIRDSTFDGAHWQRYRDVNERFAVTLANVAPNNAVVWVHDYHLQLVPGILRRLRPDVAIGWFNHIPFPPLELFQRLPWRSEIIEGLLGADLVGFQRDLGARNFVAAAHQLVNVVGDADDHWLHHDGHSTMVGAFPISIDVEEFEERAAGRETRRRAAAIRARLGDPEVVLLGIDRLDYTKGIGSRLRAVGDLFDSGDLDPHRHVFVQVATPTRDGVDHYTEERHEIERLVGAINGDHARLGYPVVHYLHRTLDLDELVALYRAGDIMLVTPFRDGMNLVAKEYVATRLDDDGVLVLSEFTGAADQLSEAVLVNPHDPHSLTDGISAAVDMHRHDRRARMSAMRATINRHNVTHWADGFLKALGAR